VKFPEVAAALHGEVLIDGGDLDLEIVVASDGMSEILAFHRPHALMLTGLTNVQSVRTAVVADVSAIVYVRGKRPSSAVLDLARDKSIPVLVTEHGMFESCGILYREGLKGAM
jgi:predicted transcriptional regulator